MSIKAARYFSCVDGIVATMSIKEGEGLRSSSQERVQPSPGHNPKLQTLETPSKGPALEFGGLTDRCSRIREYPGEFEEKSKLIFDCKISSSREISKIMEKESEGKSKREFYFQREFLYRK